MAVLCSIIVALLIIGRSVGRAPSLRVNSYKIIPTQGPIINNKNFIIKGVVEKPDIKLAPSTNAVIGRYILPKTIFKKLSKLKPGNGNEIHITDAIQSLINDNDKFIGHNFSGKYLDCGTMKGYINSTLEIAKI